MSTARVTKDQDNWRKSLAPYEKSNTKYSVWQLINTLVPFFGLWYLAYLSLSVSYWLTIPIMVLAGGFLVRTFIIFHDCCHRSFFKNRKANTIVGNITGIMTLCSYDQWRYSHSMHHATNGNLDKRGTGDIWTLTVNEYLALSPLRRWVYRMYRNPMIMFTIGPIYTFLLIYRFNRKGAPKKERMNTYMVNVALVVIIGLLCWGIGWQAFLMIQGPIFFMSGVGGIWLFYVQHQFEESYFEEEENWNYVKAAMHGSSFYKLPRVLHWITGNIGFHHIHHLSSRVPNYFLESAHNTSPVLQDVQTITLLTSLQSLRFRIWNEDTKKFIGFKDIDTSLKVKNKKQHQKAG
ncbi:fatty acid desaturase [Paenibacillus sp. PK4536]|jgi:omega-6 fatty acid desaturase (delta-12 desaturase)|uniref:Fatty acid desaturase n=1 Tax=Paenibacillus nuruki TaxID=1886670 RepID=A0A1E3L6K1_9BACL|nr:MULTISPECIES: fatty acid desaturase [Paenibacillus]ODP29399.1 Fatty acid desaturase [Paenibacillus nuruki]TKJ93608.1 fatty acid desaturase [Paenibacillus sp. CFBP13512]WIM41053.1 fatty acid desaturase [Paenibacillus sp. PK4536]CAJ1316588.1 Fatty acid desaturase [Paenibacillus nuruki]